MIHQLKPTFRQLTWNDNSSFNVKVDVRENLLNSYHYHPELELILLRRSAGIRVIGSYKDYFTHDDLVLIGKNVPHAFFHERQYLDKSSINPPEALVIQFNENFMGKEFMELPELKGIKDLFASSRPGLCITSEGKKRIIPLMEQMLYISAFDKILLLLEIIRILINKNSWRPLAVEGSMGSSDMEVGERINRVLDFTIENYDQNIKIEEVARIINMTKESFCRYFKTQTDKTYLEFLIELRIKKACRMIQENQLSIKEISYSCGFNSLSNFHYQFKKIIKLSPLEYKCEISKKHLS